jgi:hypothetical protein
MTNTNVEHVKTRVILRLLKQHAIDTCYVEVQFHTVMTPIFL